MDDETKEVVGQQLLDVVGQQYKQIIMLQIQLGLVQKQLQDALAPDEDAGGDDKPNGS